MKKTLLSVLFLSMIAVLGYSQSLTLSNVHGAIEQNSTIIQVGTPDSVELITYMNVKNVSNKTIQVLCKKVQLSMLDSTEMTMCWAGNCYPAPVNVSPFSQTMTAGQVVTDFVGHYTQVAFQHFKSGESVIRWVFYDKDNTNDSASVTIKYTTYPLGTEETGSRLATMSAPSPNPANASAVVRFGNLPGSQASIVVRNLVGETIMTESITPGATKMTIGTSTLGDGLYFVSLLVDGKLNQTRKLVVKH